MNSILALIVSEPPQNSVKVLRPLQSPVNLPWPPWVWMLIAAGSLLAIFGLMYLLRYLGKRRGVDVKPAARVVALRALAELGARIGRLKPYAFSIEVSDILRLYISRQFRLQATRQTSPEFLASIASHTGFTIEDRASLGKFLERCDRIKFAGENGTEEDSRELLDTAVAFVQGGHGE